MHLHTGDKAAGWRELASLGEEAMMGESHNLRPIFLCSTADYVSHQKNSPSLFPEAKTDVRACSAVVVLVHLSREDTNNGLNKVISAGERRHGGLNQGSLEGPLTLARSFEATQRPQPDSLSACV